MKPNKLQLDYFLIMLYDCNIGGKMAQILSTIRPYMEVLYFISGVGLLITAIYALKQLNLTKKSMSLQAKRDSLRITSEQCEKYLNHIINLQDILYEQVKQNNIGFFKGWNVDFINNSIIVKHSSPINNTNLDIIAPYFLDVLNAMEAFSSYFVSGLADEEVAYFTVGSTFIKSTEDLIPLFCVNNLQNDGYFKNIMDLYILWKRRNKLVELEKNKKLIENELEKTNLEFIIPIGV